MVQAFPPNEPVHRIKAFLVPSSVSSYSPGIIPLFLATRTPAKTNQVKAEMRRGRTCALISVVEIPPEITTVATRMTIAARIVENMERSTRLVFVGQVPDSRFGFGGGVHFLDPLSGRSSTPGCSTMGPGHRVLSHGVPLARVRLQPDPGCEPAPGREDRRRGDSR